MRKLRLISVEIAIVRSNRLLETQRLEQIMRSEASELLERALELPRLSVVAFVWNAVTPVIVVSC